MPKYEGSTITEAIEKGLTALNLAKSEVEITILEEGKRGFLGMGKKEAVVSIEPLVTEVSSEVVEEMIDEVLTEEIVEPVIVEEMVLEESLVENVQDEEAIKQLALYLTAITKDMNAPAMVRLERQESLLVFHLENEKQGMLIGKHGKVLNALQYLAQVFIHRIAKNKISVVVNVGDYREKRTEILRGLAERTANKAKSSGQAVFLEPMPAFERKQIHSVLTEDPYVKTHSEGDEPYRYLVVEPAKKQI